MWKDCIFHIYSIWSKLLPCNKQDGNLGYKDDNTLWKFNCRWTYVKAYLSFDIRVEDLDSEIW